MLPKFIYVLKFIGIALAYTVCGMICLLIPLMLLDQFGVWWAFEDITGSIWFVLCIIWIPFAFYISGKKVFGWDIYNDPWLHERRQKRKLKRAYRKQNRRRKVQNIINYTTDAAINATEKAIDASSYAVGCLWLLLPVLLLAIVILLIILLTR